MILSTSFPRVLGCRRTMYSTDNLCVTLAKTANALYCSWNEIAYDTSDRTVHGHPVLKLHTFQTTE